jgi:NAD+ diphosphatase
VPSIRIAQARWFTRDELSDYAEATGRLGRADSIDRVMLTSWLAEGGRRPPLHVDL